MLCCEQYFLAHFGPLEANWALFQCLSLIIASDHFHQFMTTWYPPLNWTESAAIRIASKVTKLKLVSCSLYSSGLHSLQSSFGMWWNSRFTSQMYSWQTCSNCLMPSWTKISSSLLNLCYKELRQFWKQEGVKSSTSKAYLTKWPVSVYYWGLI